MPPIDLAVLCQFIYDFIVIDTENNIVLTLHKHECLQMVLCERTSYSAFDYLQRREGPFTSYLCDRKRQEIPVCKSDTRKGVC